MELSVSKSPVLRDTEEAVCSQGPVIHSEVIKKEESVALDNLFLHSNSVSVLWGGEVNMSLPVLSMG